MRTDMEAMHHQTSSPTPPPPSHQPLHSWAAAYSSPNAHLHSSPQATTSQQQQQPSYLQNQSSVSHGQYANHDNQHELQSGPNPQVQDEQQDKEVQLLRQQLQEAQAEAGELAAENERLMEMSNALRSAVSRSALAQQQQSVMTIANSGSTQHPCTSRPPAAAVQPQQIYYQTQQDYIMQPHSMQWANQGNPQQLPHAHLLQPQMQQPMVSSQGQGSSGQPWQSVQQQPVEQMAGPVEQHQHAARHSTAEDPLPSEVWVRFVNNLCLCGLAAVPQL